MAVYPIGNYEVIDEFKFLGNLERFQSTYEYKLLQAFVCAKALTIDEHNSLMDVLADIVSVADTDIEILFSKFEETGSISKNNEFEKIRNKRDELLEKSIKAIDALNF